jgi:hypothetical protein
MLKRRYRLGERALGVAIELRRIPLSAILPTHGETIRTENSGVAYTSGG